MGRVFIGGGTGTVDTGGGGGGVGSVSGVSPIESTGGTNPEISLTLPGQTEGDILYFDGTSWTRLPAGVAGQALTTEGPGMPPQWTTAAAGGVSDVTASSPIASSGGPTPNITFDIAGQTEGDVVYFDGANWVRLPIGANGQVLTSQGAGHPPIWATPATAVTDVTATPPIVSSGGTTPDISITPATDAAAGSMSAADKTKLDALIGAANSGTPVAGGPFTSINAEGGLVASNGGGGVLDLSAPIGTVTAVTATAPITSTGGPAPDIAITPATEAAAGSMSAADKTKLDTLIAAQNSGTPLAGGPFTTINAEGGLVASAGGPGILDLTAPPSDGPIFPRGLSNAGPSSSFSPGAEIPVGAVFAMQAAGACNLVFDPTTFVRGAPGDTTTFGPFVWGVRSASLFINSTGKHPLAIPPFPADVFRYDVTSGMFDVIEMNDVGPDALLAGASPCQGNIVVDATGTAWTIEQTSNVLVKIQSEPPQVAKTYPIPSASKNLLAYDSVNNAIILFGISDVVLAVFDIATEAFTADVAVTGLTPDALYQSVFYTPVAGAPNGGYVFVGGALGVGPEPRPFDVFMVEPVFPLTTVASQTGLVGYNDICPTGFTYLADANKLFVSIGADINRFTVGVGTLTFDALFPVSDSVELAGMATATMAATFDFPADNYYDGTTNLVWVADQFTTKLVAFNASTQAIAFTVDLSVLPWFGEGANRVIGDGTNVYVLSEFNSPLFVSVSQTTGAINGYGQVTDSFAEDMVIGGPDQLYVVSSNGYGGANNIELFSIAALLAASLLLPATPTVTTPVTQSYSSVTYDPSGPFVYAGTEGQSPSELLNQLDPGTLAITNTLPFSDANFFAFTRLLVADGSIWATSDDPDVLRIDIATFPSAPIIITILTPSFVETWGVSYDPTDDTILVGDSDNGSVYRIAASGLNINTVVSTLTPAPSVFVSQAAVIAYNAGAPTGPMIWVLGAFPQPTGSGPGFVALFTTPVGSEAQTANIFDIGPGVDVLWVTDLGRPDVFMIRDPANTFTPITEFPTGAGFNGDTNSIVVTGPASFLVASDALDELYPMSSSGSFTNVFDIAGRLEAIYPGGSGQVFTSNGPGELPSWQTLSSAANYPELPGTGTNLYAPVSAGTIAEVVPTQTTLGADLNSGLQVDGFVAIIRSVAAPPRIVAQIEVPNGQAFSQAIDVSLSLLAVDWDASSAAEVSIYRADFVFTAYYDPAVGVVTLPPAPAPTNVRSTGLGAGWTATLVPAGPGSPFLNVAVAGAGIAGSADWSCIGQVQQVN